MKRVHRSHGADEFRPSALAIIETPPSPARREYLFVLCALFAAALAWSWFGRMASFAEAQGRIQAAGRTKVIEPRATGQVTTIRVRDGDRVSKGAVLVQLDPTDAEATRALITGQLVDLRAEIARWQAEIAAAGLTAGRDPIDLDPAITWNADIPQSVRQREDGVLHADLAQFAAALADLRARRDEKTSEKNKFAGAIAAQKGLVATISQEVAMYQQLESQGWASQAKLLVVLSRLKEAQTELTMLEGSLANAAAAIPVIDSKIVATRQSFIAQDTQQLVAVDRQVDDLTQQLRKAEQAVADTTLRAPISGTVQASAVTTIGQVVTPGQQLMQIVPQGVPLQIQAYIPNTDIGFIKVGERAEIKVATFPYATYGTIEGRVATLANNALPASGKNKLQTASLDGALAQTTAAQDTANIMFPVVVTPSRTSMKINGRKIPLMPGMAVEVDLKTEELRPLDYVLAPLIDLFSTAAHER